ncbi:enolase [Penicillium hispanicum]|uniref:enolase n=1 Tax=Penicillium hispanicum TaxID=1080232 RepID=UPI00254067B5|nr:enolase [Penicillium hispanicum]KAJ5593929.1 enolase [Penicillium hispanicum]
MIKTVKAAQRLDSRGNPTIQVNLTTQQGEFYASVPSGASTGANEAVELRDGDPSKYGGKEVGQAISNVEKIIAPNLIKSGLRVGLDQKKIDQLLNTLDGSDNKANLGANAILGVSMACARAGATHSGIQLYEFLRRESGAKEPYVLPVPFFNIVNGGVHSGNKLAFQEMMIAPVGASCVSEAVRMASEVYQQLKKVVTKQFGASAIGIGDEGGFAPPISQPHEALDLLVQAVSDAGYEGKIKFAIDPASSEFYKDGGYNLGFKDDKSNVHSPKQLMDLYHSLLQEYPIVLLEDPFAENDWDSWTEFHRNCAVELVGDDLLVTNTKFVQEAYERKACDSMLLKINQIGTVSEAIEAANLAHSYGWGVFVSHRSGETTDDFIADLVVGLRTGHIKSGAPCRGERVAKYNRLMEIEETLLARGEEFVYAGNNFRRAFHL